MPKIVDIDFSEPDPISGAEVTPDEEEVEREDFALWRGFKPSGDQVKVVEAIEEWADDGERQELTFGGLAGTGKTTLIAHLGDLLHRKVRYCAPTGKAARVLTAKLPGGVFASTIHQLIYHPIEQHCSKCPTHYDSTAICHATQRSTCGCRIEWADTEAKDWPLTVVDESSMLDKTLYTALLDYLDDAPVLFVGDHGQLPPVKGSFNLMQNPDIKLEVIHRQVADSPILKLAMMARQTGVIPYGKFGPNVAKVRSTNEVEWDDESLILCYTNATRVAFNDWIREGLGRTGLPRPGDRVICLKNNWRAGIYNGLIGVITMIQPYNKDWYDATIRLEDGRLYSGRISRRQFGNKETLLNDQADLWDYGYCLTVHKAQGSQADKVVVIEEHLPYIDDDTWRRWLYTAVTRAVSELTIVEER